MIHDDILAFFWAFLFFKLFSASTSLRSFSILIIFQFQTAMSEINHKVNFRSYVLPCVMKANGNIAIDTKSKPADGIDLNHLLNKGFLYHYNSNTCHFYPLSLLLIIKYLSPQKLLKCQNIFSFLSSSSLTLQQRKSEYKILRLNFWYIFNILDRNFCYPASKSTTGKKKTFKEMESRRD